MSGPIVLAIGRGIEGEATEASLATLHPETVEALLEWETVSRRYAPGQPEVLEWLEFRGAQLVEVVIASGLECELNGPENELGELPTPAPKSGVGNSAAESAPEPEAAAEPEPGAAAEPEPLPASDPLWAFSPDPEWGHTVEPGPAIEADPAAAEDLDAHYGAAGDVEFAVDADEADDAEVADKAAAQEKSDPGPADPDPAGTEPTAPNSPPSARLPRLGTEGEPTPWGTGLVLAGIIGVVTTIVMVGISAGLAAIHGLLAVAATLAIAGGAAPSLWFWRRQPGYRWICLGVAAGLCLGLPGGLLGGAG